MILTGLIEIGIVTDLAGLTVALVAPVALFFSILSTFQKQNIFFFLALNHSIFLAWPFIHSFNSLVLFAQASFFFALQQSKKMLKAILFVGLLASSLVTGHFTVRPDVDITKVVQRTHAPTLKNAAAGGSSTVTTSSPCGSMFGQTPSTSQTVYVNSGGSDSLGDGSNTNPYATVGKAMTSITDASLSKTYSIQIGAGRFTEVSLALKPWVFMIGQQYEATKFSISGGTKELTLHADFANGGNRAGLFNLYLNAGTGINFDLLTIGGSPTPSAVIALEQVWVGGAFTMKGRPQGIDFLEQFGGFVFGTVSIDSVYIQSQGWQVAGDVVLTVDQFSTSGSLTNLVVMGDTHVQAATGKTNTQDFYSSSLVGGLLADGAGVQVGVDAIASYDPPVQVLGAQVILRTHASSIAYAPSTSSDWDSPPPTTVQEALDRLAASP